MVSAPDLKPSRFNVVLPIEGGSNKHLVVFNTFTQALSIFEPVVWAQLTEESGETQNKELVKECRKQMFLVDQNIDETRLLLERKHEMAYNTRALYFKVVVTDHCNFACSYCIEEGYRGKRHMSSSLARQTATFILERIRENNPEKVYLDYAGGEPLLNVDVMNMIAESISTYCKGAKIEFAISFVTNGSLLTKDRLLRLKQAGLQNINVSLLPPRKHDRLRLDKNGDPTFDRIVSNLVSVKSITPFTIVSQYDSEDDEFTGSFSELLVCLEESGLKDSIKGINVGSILNRERGWAAEAEFCGVVGEFGKYSQIVEEIRKGGFPVHDGPPGTDCLANYRGRFIIDPSGNLTNCAPMLNHPELNVGSVWTGVDPIMKPHIMGRKLPDTCIEECVLAPRCNGGCRYQALIGSGSFDHIFCNYAFHMDQLKDFMMRRAKGYLAQNKMLQH